MLENLRKIEVKVQKAVDKWDRAFLLDSKHLSSNIIITKYRTRKTILMGSREVNLIKRGGKKR